MAITWKKLAYEADVITKALFDAQSILAATTDNTPAALVVAEQEVVGRLTGGNVDGISLGIADNNVVQIDAADVADDEIARFTANGLEGRTPAEVAATMALDDIGVPDAAVDFDLQQATDLVVMTVANEAALPAGAGTVAVGQLCWATGELSLHICTVAV